MSSAKTRGPLGRVGLQTLFAESADRAALCASFHVDVSAYLSVDVCSVVYIELNVYSFSNV